MVNMIFFLLALSPFYLHYDEVHFSSFAERSEVIICENYSRIRHQHEKINQRLQRVHLLFFFLNFIKFKIYMIKVRYVNKLNMLLHIMKINK